MLPAEYIYALSLIVKSLFTLNCLTFSSFAVAGCPDDFPEDLDSLLLVVLHDKGLLRQVSSSGEERI